MNIFLKVIFIFKVTLLAGVLQIILFLIFLRIEEGSTLNLQSCLNKYIIEDWKTTAKMAVPPTLLVLSTELLRNASFILPKEANEAKTFYIFGVAAFSFVILRKKFLLTQMIAISFIAFGLANFENNSTLSLFTTSSLLTENAIYGYLTILAAICCYGLSYSLLEYYLKLGDAPLWIRGIQLNIFSVPISLIIVLANHYMNNQGSFCQGFNIIAWFFIIFVCSCNMIELFVLKVADGMHRMISLASATMLIAIMQYTLAYDSLNSSSLKIGCGLVISGTFLYSIIDLINAPNDNIEDNGMTRDCPGEVSVKNIYQSVPTVSYKVKA